MLNKKLLTTAVGTALLAGALTTPVQAFDISANVALVSDYRFRGISQTNKKPAFQGGCDLAHASGIYLGNWNSNIDSAFFAGSNLEMDFYGGYKGAFDAFSYDVGLLYYSYPGSSPKIDNTELYVGGGWGPVSVKYSYALSDFFGLPDSDGSWYLDTKLAYPLTKELTLIARVGYQSLKGGAKLTEIDGSGPKDSITDWTLGVSYDMAGWALGASYIGTNRSLQGSVAGRDISGDTFMVSVGKSF